MTHSVSNLHEAQTVIVGVDTHKHMHVAVAIDSRGIRLGAALVHNSRSRSIITLHPEIRGPA